MSAARTDECMPLTSPSSKRACDRMLNADETCTTWNALDAGAMADPDPVDRKAAGVRRYHVHRSIADPTFVMIDLEFDSVAEAESLLERLRHFFGPAQV